MLANVSDILLDYGLEEIYPTSDAVRGTEALAVLYAMVKGAATVFLQDRIADAATLCLSRRYRAAEVPAQRLAKSVAVSAAELRVVVCGLTLFWDNLKRLRWFSAPPRLEPYEQKPSLRACSRSNAPRTRSRV